MYLMNLVVELANPDKPSNSRQSAGFLLKNILTSKDETIYAQLEKQWHDIDSETKEMVKRQILETLHSTSKEVRMVTAQVLAKIAVVELKNNGWLEVLKALVDNVVKPKTEQGVESSLTALGYICEESVSVKNFLLCILELTLFYVIGNVERHFLEELFE